MAEFHSKLLSDIKSKLKKDLSIERYEHILGVEKTACYIGKNLNLDVKKLTLAALLHDIAKGYTLEQLIDFLNEQKIVLDPLESTNHGLLHGKVARIIAHKTYHIDDKDILNAISSHTTGRVGMSNYEEVLFIADYTEPSRNLPDSDLIIKQSLKNLQEAVFKVISAKIIYVIEKRKSIHTRSIETYNHYHKILQNN